MANGLEQAVTAAFADRPRLVDGWPGFLGLETFTETGDATMFLWSRVGPIARRFTRGMGAARIATPTSGCRKDCASIRRALNSSNGNGFPRGGAPDAAAVAMDAVAAMGVYLEQTRVVHVVRFTLTGEIEMMNPAMASHLGLAQAPIGGSLFEYLTESDAAVVRQSAERSHRTHPNP